MAVQTLAYDAGTDLAVNVDGYANTTYELVFFPDPVDYAAGEDYGRAREQQRGIAIGRQRGYNTGFEEGQLVGYNDGRRFGLAAGIASAPAPATDTISPTIAAVSPTPNTPPGSVGAFAANYETARDTEIVLDATDASGLRFVSVNALFLDGTSEPVYLGSSFVHGYLANSYEVAITNGKRLRIRRDASWPGAPTSSTPLAVGLLINAIDTAGNVASTTLYWQLPLEVLISPVAAVAVATSAADMTAEILDMVIWQFRSA